MNEKEREIQYQGLYPAADDEIQALERLVKIIKILRKECPWDRAQTHESLRTCMLEEAYEAVDAIDHKDMDNLEEELGDVALQVVFHSCLAQENGIFSLCSVLNRECDKMIRRHPHIFYKETVKSIDKALEKWENVKRREKGELSHRERLEGVPKALPALTRSYKIQSKAAEVGFDWEDVEGAFQKLEEEAAELRQACKASDPEHIAEEVGDLLFSVVNVARFLHVNPEQALSSTSEKFIRRFSFIEQAANLKGKNLEEMSLLEMDKLWDEAKLAEKQNCE